MLFYVAFNSKGHIVTGRLQVEETSAYCTVNHQKLASNYQLSNMKRPVRDSNRWPQRLVLFIYLFGVFTSLSTLYRSTGSLKGRGNQYIQFARVVYCKLPTNGKQLPAFPLKAVTGIEPRPQRWEARVLPLCHRGPASEVGGKNSNSYTTEPPQFSVKDISRYFIVFLRFRFIC